MKFTLEIDCDNEAFEDNPTVEVYRILEVVNAKLLDGSTSGKMRDLNGNTVGTFALEDEPDDEDDDKTYKIVRYTADMDDPDFHKVIKTGLTLEEAQEHCEDESTHGDGWFDGYTEE